MKIKRIRIEYTKLKQSYTCWEEERNVFVLCGRFQPFCIIFFFSAHDFLCYYFVHKKCVTRSHMHSITRSLAYPLVHKIAMNKLLAGKKSISYKNRCKLFWKFTWNLKLSSNDLYRTQMCHILHLVVNWAKNMWPAPETPRIEICFIVPNVEIYIAIRFGVVGSTNRI